MLRLRRQDGIMPQKKRDAKVRGLRLPLGEVITYRWYEGRNNPEFARWGRMFGENIEAVLDARLNRVELWVLLLAMSSHEKDNHIPYSQKRMSQRLGVSQHSISTAVRSLVDKGLFLRDGNEYYLTHKICAEGGASDIYAIRKREAELERKMLEKT